MMDDDRRSAAASAAERVLADFSITALPVDPFQIARQCEIKVEGRPLEGASGVLVLAENALGILYSTTMANAGFQRFSVAHELGHYFLAGHWEALLASGVHHSRAGFVSNDHYETEADYFAAGLLMPRTLFTTATASTSGLDAVVAGANACSTSLESCAIRYTQCAAEPVAMVVSTGARINYAFMSEALKAKRGLDWIKKDQPLPRDSATFKFSTDPDRVRRADRADATGDIQEWFGGSRSDEIVEEVIGLGKYGRTLTILSGFSLAEEEDEDEDRDLEESWTPRFRR